MNAMLTDEDLSRLLGEASEAYVVPVDGPRAILDARAGDAPGKPLLRRRWVQLTAAAAAVVVAAVLAQSAGRSGAFLQKNTTASGVPAGATNTRSTPGGATTSGTTAATGGAATLGAAQPPASASGLNGFKAPTTVPQPMAAAPDAATGSFSGDPGDLSRLSSGSSARAPVTPVGDGAESRVVQTGTVSLAVDDGKVSAAAAAVTAIATQVRGKVSDSTSQELGDNPTATITLRVPVARFGDALTLVRALKAEVVSQQTSEKDVTATYADTEAQIASLRAARSRFLTILAGARTIGETLTVQQRVDDVQGRIDRLEGQRRVLADQSDLATLTVTVGEKTDAVLKTSTPSGLSKAWSDAKDGFTGGIESLIARSGRALLVLIVAVVVLVVLRLGWRLARRRLV